MCGISNCQSRHGSASCWLLATDLGIACGEKAPSLPLRPGRLPFLPPLVPALPVTIKNVNKHSENKNIKKKKKLSWCMTSLKLHSFYEIEAPLRALEIDVSLQVQVSLQVHFNFHAT